ncbi:BRO-N domain-containing protein [Pseudomonas lundensis]|uniref:BRO-N domain-containing protein n=1 Tax=Pseudomonas lundensis TaxID=86185 RepID=UPI001476794D|nr:Bro-N domain-containing protein [Pseudomonas lundensis]NNA42168.1 Bro-N domain-containing protein [Pseudomonas lundensis]
MSDISTATSNVIPFKFGKQQVRTLLIDDQPWFVAADVSSALEYRIAGDMTRNLDEDEKGTQIVRTPGGAQEMLVINESGLYSAILRSRKAEAKIFKKWVTAEVLPAIRKYGRYEDSTGKLNTLVGQTIGADGFHMLGAVVKGKVSNLPAPAQRRATAKIWAQTHAAFGVRSAADIPADQLDSARNFIAAYVVLEGEYLPREPKSERLNIHFPIQALAGRRQGMLTDRGDGRAWLDVRLEDVGYHHDSLCELIIFELQRAGYVVDAAQWELATYRNKLRGISSFVTGLNRVVEEPHRYAVDSGEAA